MNGCGPSGSRRRFQPDIRGGFFSQPGDHATLTPSVGGGFTLTELDGQVTEFNADGVLQYIQDTNGNRVTAGHTGGLLTSLTHSSGQSLTLAYNAAGLVSSIADSASRTTTYVYDPSNKYLVSVVNFDGQTTSYSYDIGPMANTAHALLAVAHSDGTHDFFSYDARGQLANVQRDGGAESTNFTYDMGQVAATDALGGRTIYSFDHEGMLAKVQNPLNSTVSFVYDQFLNLVRTTDTLNQTYINTYDRRGNLVSTTDPLGNTVSYKYAINNNRLAAVTDPKGNTTNYGYDGKGNLTSTTYADGTVERIAYDPVGNVLAVTNRRGQPIGYTYNASGNVLTKSYADNSVVIFTYDTHENLTSATDSSGVTALTYDATDRLRKITYPSGRYLQYSYDTAGRRTQMVDQTGYTVNYTYDVAGRLDTLTDGSNALIVDYSYDLAGRIARKDNGNSTYTTYEYDPAGQLLQLINVAPDGAINSRFDYTYDSLGRRVIEETLDGDWAYTYDAIGQLTHAVFTSTNPAIASQNLAYAYDASGNRTQTIFNGVTTSYTTNNLNQYMAAGSARYSYDADGNMISASRNNATTVYTYDADMRVTQIAGSGKTWLYKYDAFGSRVTTMHGNSVSQYMIDPFGLGDVVSSYDAEGVLQAHYTHALGLVSQTDRNATSFVDVSGSGGMIGLSNYEGTYTSRYNYLPFGEKSSGDQASTTLFGFVGQLGVIDDGNGTLFMRARQYDPSTGHFLSDDPLGIVGGDSNLRRYALNDPISFVDPEGLTAYIYVQATGRFYAVGGRLNRTGYSGSLAFGGFNNPDAQKWKNVGPIPVGNYEITDKVQQLHGKAHQNVLVLKAMSGTDLFDRDSFLIHGYGEKYPWAASNGCIILTPDIRALLKKGDTITVIAVESMDPNAKYGPAGFGPEAFITSAQDFPYRIDFENDATASAPAQRVDVTDQLDNSLDWSSFQWTGIGFGDNAIAIPLGQQHFQTTVEMSYNNQTFQVIVDLSLNAATGKLHAAFQSVEPKTSLPPDVLTGFLPPENGTGRGQGFISYLIRPKPTLPTGTKIRNVALITFDLGETIATNQIDPHDPSKGTDSTKEALNTIDAAGPASSVATLPSSSPGSFTLSWSGMDDVGGSGIGSYDIYVSVDEGPFSLWFNDTTQTSGTYTGQNGHSYAFYSVATDNVGYQEAAPTTADALTTVFINSPPAITLVSLSPTTAFETTTLTATPVGGGDADGDTITYSYQWFVNGVLIAPTTNTLDGAYFNKGDVVSLRVTPNDGTANGAAVDSSTVTISNSLPVVTSVSLTPTTAFEATTLTATPVGGSDADGDTITYSYQWFVNGVLIAPTTVTLSGAHFNKGNTVSVRVTPNDGSGNGSSMDSSVITISNSSPTVAGQSVTTASGFSKSLTLTGNDVDGDLLSYLVVTSPAHGSLSGTAPNIVYTPTANYVGSDSFSYRANDGTVDSSLAVITITVAGGNDAPVLGNITSTSVDENGIVHLTGTYRDANVQDTHTITINWNFGNNVGGQIEGTITIVTIGPNVEGTLLSYLGDGNWAFTASHLYLDDNPTNSASDLYSISVIIADNHGATGSAMTSTTITNVAPNVTSVASSSDTLATRSADGIVSILGAFTDVGSLDTHRVMIDWGDGLAATQLAVDPIRRTFAGSRTFATGGVFTIAVWAIDDDGGISLPKRATAYVEGVGLVGPVLYVIGTDGKDDVDVKLAGGKNFDRLEVKAKLTKGHGSVQYNSTFDIGKVEQIVMYLAGDDDKAKIDKDVEIDSTIFGGTGKDKLEGGGGRDYLYGEDGDDDLSGGRGSDVLIGGFGDDKLRGGSDAGSDSEFEGRDVLIGGQGEDELSADKGDDFLVGGYTAYDTNAVALALISREWTSTRNYESRVANLRAGTGEFLSGSGVSLKSTGTGKTVFDDGVRDKLNSGPGRDWYFADFGTDDKNRDKLTGRINDELVDWVTG